MASTPPSSPHRSWRANRASGPATPEAKRPRLILLSLIAAALLVVLAMVLVRPFLHPNPHFVALPVTTHDVLYAPPIAYVDEDVQAFAELEPSLYRDATGLGLRVLANFQNSATLDHLASDLDGGVVSSRDVLIVYLNAHGISDNGRAYLLCSDYDMTVDPETGRYALSELLDQIRRCPAKWKLLIMDSGRIASDPRMGMVFNEFPRLLEHLLGPKGEGCCDETHVDDPNFWVFSSNSLLETSHVWPPLKRSVFGYVLAEGLKGEADRDGDREVDLEELAAFVTHNVSVWVKKYGGGATQTPMLLRGGTGRDLPTKEMKELVLLPVPRRDQAEEIPQQEQEYERETRKEEDSGENAEPKSAKSEQQTQRQPEGTRHAFLGNVQEVSRSERALRQPPQRQAASTDKASSSGVEQPKGRPGNIAAGTSVSGEAVPQAKPAAEKGAKNTATETPGEKTASKDRSTLDAQGQDDMAAVRNLLQQAWKLRDEVEERTQENRWSPVDYAPHLWREFTELLLGYELQYRSGAASNPTDLGARLRAELLPIANSLQSWHLPSSGKQGIVERIAQARSRFLGELEEPRSLAMAHLVAWNNPTWPDLRKLEDEFESRLSQDSLPTGEFRDWVSRRLERGTYREMAEFHLAVRLKRVSELVDWDTVRLALQTRRLAERAAAYGDWCTPWVQDRVKQADYLRLRGERQLELATGYDKKAQEAGNLLLQVTDHYENVRRDAELIKQAIELKNDLIFRAPYYVQWYARANLDRSRDIPSYSDIKQLLEALAGLVSILEADDPRALDQIRDQKEKLAKLQQDIEQWLGKDYVQTLIQDPNASGSAREIQDLLSTPLLRASERLRLLDALDQVTPKTSSDFPAAAGFGGTLPLKTLSHEDWKRMAQLADLELRLFRLGGALDLGDEELRQVEEQLRAVTALPSQIPDDEEAAWKEYRRTGHALKRFYRMLPGVIGAEVRQNEDLSDRETRAERLRTLGSLERLLRLVQAHDAKQVRAATGAKSANPIECIRRANLYDLIVWHHERFRRSRDDGDPMQEEADWLEASAEICWQQANSIPGQPQLQADRGGQHVRLHLDGDKRVQLVRDKSQPLKVTVEALGDFRGSVELRAELQYDPNRLEIRDPDRSPPEKKFSFRLTAGDRKDLYFNMRSKPGFMAADQRSTRVIVLVKTAGASALHESEVLSPSPDPVELLVVPVVPGTVFSNKDALSLHPFPNRATEYHFKLVNHSGKERTVQVELWTMPDPLHNRRHPNLPFDETGNLIPGVEEPQLLTRVKDQKLPAEPAPQPVQFDPVPKAEAEASHRQIRYGLVCLVRDEEKTIVRLLKIEPQHPRSYLVPTVGYDPRQGMLSIQVKARDPKRLPKDPSPVIRWDIEPSHPALKQGGRMKIEDELRAPDFNAELYAEVEPDPRKTIEVWLTADGYPRAFVYKVPCSAARDNFLPEEHLRMIRILAPQSGQAYPAGSIPVELQVDAPIDAFPRGSEADFIEVGIDDKDPIRELRNEKTLKFFSDRHVAVILQQIKQGGILVIDTKVADFKGDFAAPLPAGLGRALGILARLHVDGRSKWTERITVDHDATPPKISLVPPPKTVVQGEMLRVFARVEEDHSDFEAVEFGFDLDNSGSLEDNEPVHECSPADGGWMALLPTESLKPGRYKILVRATNKAHLERTERVQVTVVQPKPVVPPTPAKTTQTPPKPRLGKILVTVVLANKPQAGIRLKLEGAAITSPREAQTDPNGQFTFEKLPGGDYKLTAEGQVIDRLWRGTEQVRLQTGESAEVQIPLKFLP